MCVPLQAVQTTHSPSFPALGDIIATKWNGLLALPGNPTNLKDLKVEDWMPDTLKALAACCHFCRTHVARQTIFTLLYTPTDPEGTEREFLREVGIRLQGFICGLSLGPAGDWNSYVSSCSDVNLIILPGSFLYKLSGRLAP